MAKPLSRALFCFSLLLFVSSTHQLQSSHTQVLLQLRKHLQYPKALDVWNSKFDFCYTASSPSLSITCEGNLVTELRIVGDKPVKASDFEGLPIPGQTLSQDFSIDSFVTTLSRLSALKVVCLLSLGIWGPLPDKLHRLYALEVLDLSSNFLYGSIPLKISAMTKLQTLTLDSNFFNETVPEWFDSLSNLTYLSIKNNRLTGSLPETVGRVKNLTILALPHNNLTGNLPDLGGLSNLQVLDLRENELGSELPALPRNLVTVLLSGNSLSGDIPKQFGEMDHLQHLDASRNLLHGSPPPSLFSLKNVSYINLASNQMSGPLPKTITCAATLGFVDISNNRLEGGLPPCFNSGLENRVVKFGGNCLSVDVMHQHAISYCQASMAVKKEESGHKDAGLIVGLIVGILAVVLVLALGFLVLCKIICLRGSSEQRLLPKTHHDSSPSGFSSELMANVGYLSQVSQRTHGSALYRLYTLDELKAATNNFDQAKILGNGSAGKLYKGRLENGTYVAIRHVALSKRFSIRNLKLRLDLLSKLHHPNLVYLLGHCLDGSPNDASVKEVYLIYEYVPNENLHFHLSDHAHGKALKWSERLWILIGVAKAVHFLHSGVIPGLFNNRLKSNNVLVDEHCIAKLSDYGLSLIAEEFEKSEAKPKNLKGSPTVGQTYAMDKAKSEDDIYRFGLILLESLTGSAISESEALINEMASTLSTSDGQKKLLDPMVLTSSTRESLSLIISITSKCISPNPSARPSMEDVVWNLQYAAQIQADANGDQKL